MTYFQLRVNKLLTFNINVCYKVLIEFISCVAVNYNKNAFIFKSFIFCVLARILQDNANKNRLVLHELLLVSYAYVFYVQNTIAC